MSEPKTRCVDCGRAILQSTADRHDGRCKLCYRPVPPQDFQLSLDLAERVAALKEDPADFREMAWQLGKLGADFVYGYLDYIEERNRLYRQWSPQLRAFAAKCREDQPPPGEESLSNCERAKQRVYEEKLNLNSPHIGPGVTVVICSMPLLAIPVAQRLWPRANDRMVILTPEEKARWNEMYLHPEGAMPWFSHYWWSIDDSPKGEHRWVVTVGQSYLGSGCGRSELWSWNGRQAKFIRVLSSWL
jgi:hypothetical protein